MRCAFAFSVGLLICGSLFAQKNKKTAEGEIIFIKVEIQSGPEPKAWNAYLKNVTQLSTATGIAPGIYRVTVRFSIDKEGNLADVKAKSNPGYGLAKKAEDIILNYDGIWHPASQCGRNVKSYKEETIQFIVSN